MRPSGAVTVACVDGGRVLGFGRRLVGCNFRTIVAADTAVLSRESRHSQSTVVFLILSCVVVMVYENIEALMVVVVALLHGT